MVDLNIRFILRILIILTLFITACRASKKEELLKPAPTVSLQVVPENCPPTDSILKAIRVADLDLNWFTARISANTDIDKQSNSFNANLRIKRDSVIWMSISPALGIEVARVSITPDSLKFINRINSTYFKGDYHYLSSLLKIEANFQMIQSILLGNAYLHYRAEKYFSDCENGDQILSTLKRRRIRRESELELPEILTQEVWYSGTRKKIHRMEMQDYRPVRKLSINYTVFEEIDGRMIPVELSILANADKQARIQLQYSKITVNKEVNLPFSIPENYEKIR